MLAALVLPACALAHVTIAPPFVNDGIASKISFEAPNERAPHATIELRTSAPPVCASSRQPLRRAGASR